MEHCRGTSVDYYCHPIVIKPTSFYEHYRRPFTHSQLISRESYQQVPLPVPATAHQRRDGSPYHHSYHHHQHHGRTARADVTGYDDVMESRCVTSFTELQPASRAPARSLVVQSLEGSTGWTSTPPPFSHSQHCKCFTRFFISQLAAMFCPPAFSRPRYEGWSHHKQSFSIDVRLPHSLLVLSITTQSTILLSIHVILGLPRVREPGAVYLVLFPSSCSPLSFSMPQLSPAVQCPFIILLAVTPRYPYKTCLDT